MTIAVSTTINGVPTSLEVEVYQPLVDVLRARGFTGVKVNCRLGECGVCTILLDGKPVHGCLTLAVHAEGREVTTIEGNSDALARELQRSLAAHQGLQCGYCTPGMVASLTAFIRSLPDPDSATRNDIRKAIAGNICRCTGYEQIIEAAEDAMKAVSGLAGTADPIRGQ